MIVSHFKDLGKALVRAYQQRRLTEIGQGPLLETLNRLRTLIMFSAPVGRDEPGFGRPSVRIWGKPLLQSWQQVEVGDHPEGRGLLGRMDLDHPSVGNNQWQGDILDWLMAGTPPHWVPDVVSSDQRVKVAFWWGSPLRWPPRDGGPPGFRFYNRPVGISTFDRGFWARPEGDFVQEQVNKQQGSLDATVDQTMRTFVFGPLDASPYLSKFGGE